MTDRAPDFFDPETFADLSVREIATSSRFDASESAEDLRMAELDELGPGARPGADRSGRQSTPYSPRAGRRHALSALAAGLAVAGAVIVHSVAGTSVVPSPRRPLIVSSHAPMVSEGSGPRSHSGSVTARRSSRGTAPAVRLPILTDRARPPARPVARSSATQAPVARSDEFGFER